MEEGRGGGGMQRTKQEPGTVKCGTVWTYLESRHDKVKWNWHVLGDLHERLRCPKLCKLCVLPLVTKQSILRRVHLVDANNLRVQYKIEKTTQLGISRAVVDSRHR